jgi:hypothetical protein
MKLSQPDPVKLEIFNNLFRSIAEQMGTTLQNTSYSVNIKERLDFSCAIFDSQGNLVANAPHIPVHLGSMSESVRSLIESVRAIASRSPLQPGDVYMQNNPYNGGTHLPDITVITPVFSPISPAPPTEGARSDLPCSPHRRCAKRPPLSPLPLSPFSTLLRGDTMQILAASLLVQCLLIAKLLKKKVF